MKLVYRLTALMGLLPAALAGCTRQSSVLLNLGGPHAEATSKLFWLFAGVSAAVWILVLGFLFFALSRQRERGLVAPAQPAAVRERRLLIGVSTCIGLTIVILTALVCVSYATDKHLIDYDKKPALDIEVTGHQWWWEVRYPGTTPVETFTTANEIHIPVDTKVRLILKTSDVIHSMWIPNLAGKRDIIPGHEQNLVIMADRVGQWHGQCGEFCGLQHAYMGLTLYAEPKEQFDAWQTAQRLPSPDPVTEEEKHGQQVFMSGACATCHAIRTSGATSQSNNAPDLTHLKSRSTIGATAVPNTKGYLGGWIVDPHSIKPGVHMPTILQEPQDFQALLAYLETLK